MNTLAVSYDLSKPGQAYSKLIEHLKTYNDWWHCLESTWLIRTPYGPTDVCNRLKPYIDANDKVVVINVTGDPAAWVGLDQGCSDWLRKNL